ncbi:MAG: hypothetical protein ACI90V_004895 [Bacillariaceae sp.]|jgi:hypothetical protein
MGNIFVFDEPSSINNGGAFFFGIADEDILVNDVDFDFDFDCYDMVGRV